MPDLGTVGEVPDEELDFDPIIIGITAYKPDGSGGGEKVVEKFPFVPEPPVLMRLVLLRLERAGGGRMDEGDAFNFLRGCLFEDAVLRFDQFIEGRHRIHAQALADACKLLVEHYGGGRPTKRSSGSSRTGSRSGRTLKAAARSKA